MIKQLEKDKIAEISSVHEQSLPESIFAILGHEFLAKYFYPELIQNEGLLCDIYEFEGKIVGFISYTSDSPSVFKKQIKIHPLVITLAVVKKLLTDISKLKYVFYAIFYLLKQQKMFLPEISCEILSFVVLPDYRTNMKDESSGKIVPTPFFQQHQVRVAEELFNSCTRRLNSSGYEMMKIMTPVKNEPSNKFYQKMGCVKTPIKGKVFGLDINVYTKRLDK